mgnify:CR=1 FL=1
MVDGAIQQQQVEAGRKLVAMQDLPVVAAIQRLGVVEGERSLDVYFAGGTASLGTRDAR